jgi:chromosome segregation ATPase
LLSEYYSLEKRYLAQVDRLFAFEQQSLRCGSQIEELRNKNEALLDRIGQEVSRRGRTGNLVMERDSLIRELKLELLKREEELRKLKHAQKKVDEQRPAMDTNKSDLASQMRKLVKAKTKLEEELVSAKKDVDWYETQSIQQQDLIRRVRRDLGVAQDLERVLRKENSVLQRKNSILQEENTILLEENATIRGDMQRLGDAVQRTQEDYREDLETIKTYYKQKLAAAQVAHGAVVASYRQEQEDLAEDARKRHQQYKESLALTTQRFMEEDRPLIEAAAVMAARDKWKGEIEQLCAQRDAEWENDFQTTQAALLQERTHLQSSIEDLRRKRNEDQRSFDKRVEKEVVKRLAGQRPAASIEPRVIAELEQRVYDLEIQLETERQEYQDRLTAAVQEGWMMGDEKVAAVLEDRDQIEADYLKVCEERDRLVQEQGEYREYCAIYLDKFEEYQVKLVDLQRAHDKVLAAQDATLAVNNDHKRNLERANEQVETLVDQVFELEEELKVVKAAQEEAKKVVRPSVYQRDTRGDGGIKRPRASTAKLPVQRQEGATGQVSKGAERQEKPGAVSQIRWRRCMNFG